MSWGKPETGEAPKSPEDCKRGMASLGWGEASQGQDRGKAGAWG